MYLLTEDVPRIAWRGRWKSMSVIERYLQDAAGAMLLNSLTSESRALIRVFADAALGLLDLFCADPSLWLKVVRRA